MDTAQVEEFYETLHIAIEDIDNYDALVLDVSDKGNYITISDDDGRIPDSLDSPIVCNLYDYNSSYQWSVTLEDSYQLKDLLAESDDMESFLASLEVIRQNNFAKYDL